MCETIKLHFQNIGQPRESGFESSEKLETANKHSWAGQEVYIGPHPGAQYYPD